MTSASVRDPLGHHLVTPENAAFLFIDYQPVQLATVRAMDHGLILKNAVSTVRTIKTFGARSFTRPSTFAARRWLNARSPHSSR